MYVYMRNNDILRWKKRQVNLAEDSDVDKRRMTAKVLRSQRHQRYNRVSKNLQDEASRRVERIEVAVENATARIGCWKDRRDA